MKQITPVIHHKDEITTLEQAKLAYECGANGVFLISHNNQDYVLPSLGVTIKSYGWKIEDKNFTVGLNLLSTSAAKAFKIVKDNNLDSIWLDHAGVSSKGITPKCEELIEISKTCPQIDVFASVAFKYQPIEKNPLLAAQLVRELGWIPTTSGTGTGVAPEVSKIQLMSEGKSLAIASGMTAENIHLFAPYLSHILVSTGISFDDYHLNPELTRQFIKVAKS